MCNQKKMNTVMKQKIFSLLVLMITTVCGAWAQGDFRVQLSVNCPVLGVENVLFYGNSEYDENELKGGINNISSNSDIKSHILEDTGKEVEISQIGSPSYPTGFSYNGSSFSITMSDDQKFTEPVNLPIDVYYNSVHYEGSVTVSVYHNTHSSTSATWEKDETYHWHQCNYGYGMCNPAASKVDLATHTYSSGSCTECDQPEPHTHSFATAWTTTATHHYHKCTGTTGTGCPLNADNLTAADVAAVTLTADEATYLAFAEHVISDGYCTSCGYDAGAGHVHVLDGYVQKTTYHYMKCTVSGCPYYGENVSQDVLTTATTTVQGVIGYGVHEDANSDGNCDACGYAIPAHVHTPGTTYVQVGTDHHYTPCTDTTCPFHAENLTAADFTDAAVAAALNFEAHTMTYYNACEKCGYHTVHTPEGYWVTNGGNHYHPCMAVGCPLSSVYLTGEEAALDDDAKTALSFGAHVDANQDNKCDVCTKDMSVHEHFFTNEWTQTATTHYHKCIAQGCTLVYTTAGLESESQDVKDAVDFGEHSFTGNVCTVCGYEKHVHHFADVTTWTQTAEGHYHKCLIQGCNITDYSSTDNLTADEIAAIAYAEHSFGTGTVCSVCGYDKAAAHVHVFGDWSETTDKQYHYKECSAAGCTITDYTNMSDLQKAETSYGKHQYGTSQEGTAYYTCKICGIENATRKAETHTHSYMWVSIPTGTGATDEDPEHWQQCTSTVGACIADQPEAGDGPRKVPAEKKHQFVTTATDYTYYTCSVCGYIDEEKKAIVPHGHVIDTETWASNDAAHYHECIGQGNCDITNYNSLPTSVTAAQATAIAYAEHTYGTSQQGAKYYTCQVCGYISETRRTEAHTHNYGEWQHDNVQHWKECSEAAGPCDAPKGSLGNHVYGTSGDARWTCSTCSFVNTARQAAILNAETAMNVQSWSWDYEIPFNFEAPVQNDRRFNANQCYTVILPYALELNGMKAYTIEQHNDKIVGFKEQAVTELPQLTPYILKSEATGNPLSMPMTTIYSTLLKSDNASDVAAWMTQAEKDALLDDRATVGNQPSINTGTSPLSMIGTLKYLKAEAVGLYILQGKDADHPNGVFKKVETAGGYDATGENRASVLPMRAYLKATTSGPARLLSVVFYAADGSVTAVERLALDEDGLAVIYDLQGRRVQNPRKGGLYIINGRKSILK